MNWTPTVLGFATPHTPFLNISATLPFLEVTIATIKRQPLPPHTDQVNPSKLVLDSESFLIMHARDRTKVGQRGEDAGLAVQLIVQITPGVSPLKWGRSDSGKIDAVKSRIHVLRNRQKLILDTISGLSSEIKNQMLIRQVLSLFFGRSCIQRKFLTAS